MKQKQSSNFKRYREAYNFVIQLQNIPTDREYMDGKVRDGGYLLRMRWFLNLLGNPDRGMRYIHMAGTSGKGSVTTMVHNMLQAFGQKVGSFKSPFMTSTIELSQVGSNYISPERFADLVDYLKPYITRAHVESPHGTPSYFEIMYALALLYFREERCAWVVLEVGLGGRYDATNVIEHPTITAITNIDYDHTEILGKTLNKIAYDKAGIIKKGSTFFTTERRPRLTNMFQKICDELAVPATILPAYPDYRQANVSLAVAIARHVGVDEASIEKGIALTRLPCRFERVQDAPGVILDGAHNRAKMQTTAENLKSLSYKKLHLVIGIKSTKDYEAILAEILPYADHVYLTRFTLYTIKCVPPKELLSVAKRFAKKGAKLEVWLDPDDALDRVIQSVGPHDCVLVTGSFYLAGQLRERWYSEERLLTKRTSF